MQKGKQKKHKILAKNDPPPKKKSCLILLDPGSICKGAGLRLLFSTMFVHLFCFFLLCLLSTCFCHGEGRYPWRAAQQESIYDGWLPEEVWILKRPVPSHLAARPPPPCCISPLPARVGSHYCFFFSFYCLLSSVCRSFFVILLSSLAFSPSSTRSWSAAEVNCC